MDPIKTNTLFINRVINLGQKSTISMKSIMVIIITIIFVIGIGLMYGKSTEEQNNDKNWRLMTSIFLGIGGSLLYCFITLLSVSYSNLTSKISPENIIEYIKLAIYLYLYIVYCIVPLIAYSKDNTQIYDVDSVYAPGHTHQYNKFVRIVHIITALLSICVFLYSLYILLWYNDRYRKRQLLPIFVFGGILCGKFIQELIILFRK